MILFLLCLLFTIPAYADTQTHIEADQADYDGKKICMNGNVHIQHDFADITCDKGVMLMDEASEKHLSPQRILLYGSVKAILHDGSILTSEEADINCQTLEGVFTASAPQKVIYRTRVEDGQETAAVKTMSRAMRVLMKKQKEEGEKSHYVVSDMQAEGAVNIEYELDK